MFGVCNHFDQLLMYFPATLSQQQYNVGLIDFYAR